jgi:hypothetical protein
MRKLSFILIVIAALAFTANATPPPAYGNYLGGWGNTPCNWTNITGSWGFWGIYQAGYGSLPCEGWNVSGMCNPDPVFVDYPSITVELWVEMYAHFYIENLVYQYHRLGNSAETIYFVISGWIKSNSPQQILLGCAAGEYLDFLYFRHDAAGNTGSAYGSDLPITWESQYTQTPGQWPGYSTIGLNNCGGVDIEVPKCDTWFKFRGCFDLPYHVDDGYYSLTMNVGVSPTF